MIVITMHKTLKKRGLSQVIRSELPIVMLITLVTFASFGLGRLSSRAEDTLGIRIDYDKEHTDSVELVASIQGTKYHYPWCPGALRIKEANKVFFSNASAAKEAQYERASNCKGLK